MSPVAIDLQKRIQSVLARFPSLTKWVQGVSACIGLDVGSHSVKGVKLARKGAAAALERFSAVPLAPGAAPAQKTKAIQEVMQALESDTGPVVTGVGGPGTVLRSVVIPKMTPQEFKTALNFESEKYIPFKLEEVFFDSVILGERSGGRMEVLLAAARRDLVNGYLELLQSAGVTPAVVDLEMVALANAWEKNHPASGSETAVLIQVGARGTLLNFMAGTQLQFTREIGLGGETFTQALAQLLQLDSAAAERLKCEPEDRAQEVRQALQSSWEEWSSQCRVSFDFYENQFGRGVGRIFLTGGSARLAGFKEWVQEAAGLPAEIWNPTAGLSSPADSESLQKSGVALGVAVGLAIRGMGR